MILKFSHNQSIFRHISVVATTINREFTLQAKTLLLKLFVTTNETCWNMDCLCENFRIIKCMVYIVKIFRQILNQTHGTNNNVKRQQGMIISFKSWRCIVTWKSTTYFIPIHVGALLSQEGTCIVILNYSFSQFQTSNIKNKAVEEY